MGHRPPPVAYHIAWDTDHKMHGFELDARGLRLGKMLDMAEMYVSSGLGGKDDESDLSMEDIAMMKTIFRLLVGNDDVAGPDIPYESGVITGWNRDGDNGRPLPVSMAGIRELELWEFQAIMDAYLQSGGVKLEDPLSDDSKNGRQFQEDTALTELESLSPLG